MKVAQQNQKTHPLPKMNCSFLIVQGINNWKIFYLLNSI